MRHTAPLCRVGRLEWSDVLSMRFFYVTIISYCCVALPETGPRISTRGRYWAGDEHKQHKSFHSYYRPGQDDQDVEINCTSSRSKPAAALHWYVDGLQVQSENLVEYAPMEEEGDSTLETAVLGLRWKLPSSDSVVLNCTAAVGSVYWSSTAVTLSPEPGKSRLPVLMYQSSSPARLTITCPVLIILFLCTVWRKKICLF